MADPTRRILVVERVQGRLSGLSGTTPQSQDSSRGSRRPGGLKAGPAPVAPKPYVGPVNRRILVVEGASGVPVPLGLSGTPFLWKLVLFDMSKVSINPELCFGRGNANQH